MGRPVAPTVCSGRARAPRCRCANPPPLPAGALLPFALQHAPLRLGPWKGPARAGTAGQSSRSGCGVCSGAYTRGGRFRAGLPTTCEAQGEAKRHVTRERARARTARSLLSWLPVRRKCDGAATPELPSTTYTALQYPPSQSRMASEGAEVCCNGLQRKAASQSSHRARARAGGVTEHTRPRAAGKGAGCIAGSHAHARRGSLFGGQGHEGGCVRSRRATIRTSQESQGPAAPPAGRAAGRPRPWPPPPPITPRPLHLKAGLTVHASAPAEPLQPRKGTKSSIRSMAWPSSASTASPPKSSTKPRTPEASASALSSGTLPVSAPCAGVGVGVE